MEVHLAKSTHSYKEKSNKKLKKCNDKQTQEDRGELDKIISWQQKGEC